MARLDRPLGPLELVLLDQVRLAAGGEGAEGVALAGDRVHDEPPLVVGAELGGEEAVGALVLDQGRGRDDGIGDRLAGVGGQDAALDDPGRLERQGGLLAGEAPWRDR